MGRPETARLTIQSVLAQKLPPGDSEILLVGQRAEEVAAEFGSKVKPVALASRLNPGQTRIEGITIARGEWLLLVDDDIELDDAFVTNLKALVAQHSNLGAVGARIPGKSTAYWAKVTDLANFWSQQNDIPGPRDWLYSATIAIQSDAYREAGGFNPAFAIGEDVDLTKRIKARGREIFYAPNLVARHNHRRETMRLSLSYFWANGDLAKYIYHQQPPMRAFSALSVIVPLFDHLTKTTRLNLRHTPRFLFYLPAVALAYTCFFISTEAHRLKYLAVAIEQPDGPRPHPQSISERLLCSSLRASTRGRRAKAAGLMLLAWAFGVAGLIPRIFRHFARNDASRS